MSLTVGSKSLTFSHVNIFRIGWTRIPLLFFAAIIFLVPSAYAAPNNNDSQPVLDLAKFTDVPALMSAVLTARTATQALLTQNPSRNDRAHLEKALTSLDAASAGGFTVANLEKFFNDLRQAVDALENVTAGKPIAGNIAESCRATTAKFLENVERAIPRLANTKTRENATKDLAKSKDDYARGVAAITAGRRGEAFNHFRQAIRRMLAYPLVPADTKPIPLIRFESGTLIFADSAGNVIETISIEENRYVLISPRQQRVLVVDAAEFGGGADRVADIYNQNGALVFHGVTSDRSGIAIADDGSLAAFEYFGDRVIDFLAPDGRTVRTSAPRGGAGQTNASFLTDTIFVLAYAGGNYDSSNIFLSDIQVHGFNALDGTEIFHRTFSFSEAMMKRTDFLEIDGASGQILIRLTSRLDNRPKIYVLDGDGRILETRDDI
jgi:hypothetical protein